MNKLMKNLKLTFQTIIINILIKIILKLYNFQFKNIKFYLRIIAIISLLYIMNYCQDYNEMEM